MAMHGLNTHNTYRYAFQGQERDDEVKGAGNSYNYKYRMHDSRLGRFFAVDPLADKYPYNSPYAFSENVVIHAVELEGLEKVELSNGTNLWGPRNPDDVRNQAGKQQSWVMNASNPSLYWGSTEESQSRLSVDSYGYIAPRYPASSNLNDLPSGGRTFYYQEPARGTAQMVIFEDLLLGGGQLIKWGARGLGSLFKSGARKLIVKAPAKAAKSSADDVAMKFVSSGESTMSGRALTDMSGDITFNVMKTRNGLYSASNTLSGSLLGSSNAVGKYVMFSSRQSLSTTSLSFGSGALKFGRFSTGTLVNVGEKSFGRMYFGNPNTYLNIGFGNASKRVLGVTAGTGFGIGVGATFTNRVILPYIKGEDDDENEKSE